MNIEPGYASKPQPAPPPSRAALRDASPVRPWRPAPHGEL